MLQISINFSENADQSFLSSDMTILRVGAFKLNFHKSEWKSWLENVIKKGIPTF